MTAAPLGGRRRARAALAVVGAALLVVGAGACSGSEQSPAEARRERVESRLRETFSGAQSRCILDRSDATLLAALDRSRSLPPEGDALASWSDVVVACVTDPDGATTTSTTTTTAVPAASSTTSPAGGLDSGITTTSR
ncbi:MAG: hypothetical protein R2746_12140 [Acidimicrobiales bacterium]